MQESISASEMQTGSASPPMYRCRWDFCTQVCDSGSELSFHFVKAHLRSMRKETIPGQKRRKIDDEIWEKVGQPSRLADQLPLPDPTPTSGGDITTTTHTTDTSLFPPPASLPSLPATFPSAFPDFRPSSSELDTLPPPPATIDFGAYLHSNPSSPVSLRLGRAISPDAPAAAVLHSPSQLARSGSVVHDTVELGSMLPPSPRQRKRRRSTSPPSSQSDPLSQPRSQRPRLSSPFLPPTQSFPAHQDESQSSASGITSSSDPTKQPIALSQSDSEGKAQPALPDGTDGRRRADSTASSSGAGSGGPTRPLLSFGALLPKSAAHPAEVQKKRSASLTGFAWGQAERAQQGAPQK